MTVSTENDPPPPSAKSSNSKFLVQIQIGQNFEFEFVPRDTKESELLDLVDIRRGSFSVETVIAYL